MQESIYNLIPKEKTPPKKVTKLYKSTIPGTIAPTGSIVEYIINFHFFQISKYSQYNSQNLTKFFEFIFFISNNTFGTQSLIIPVTNVNGSYIIQHNRYRSESGVLGKSKNQKLEPIKHRHMGNNSLDIWAEKGSIHRSVDLTHQHSATKPQIPKLCEKPIMGLKQHKNFIATNAIDVILASYILQYYLDPKKQETEPEWTKKSTYGKVPPYLTQIKDTIKEQFYEEQYRKQLEQQEQDILYFIYLIFQYFIFIQYKIDSFIKKKLIYIHLSKINYIIQSTIINYNKSLMKSQNKQDKVQKRNMMNQIININSKHIVECLEQQE